MSESQVRPKALSARTARASLWAIAGKFGAKGIDFLSLLVLARFLGPADFGLVAMAMTTLYIIEAVVDLPLGYVLLAEPEPPTASMFNTVFTLSVLRSVLLLSVLCGLSRPLASFYHEPRLVSLMCWLSLAPSMRGMQSPRMVEYGRRLNYRPAFILELTSKSVTLILVCSIAITTHSYWALAVGTVSTSAMLMTMSYVLAPMRPSLTLSEFRKFSKVIGWVSLGQVFQALNWQLDRLMLPRYTDVVSFGRFTAANDIAAIPYQAIVTPTGGPLMAAFSSVKEHEALQLVYLKASAGLTLIMAPILLTLSLLAEPLLSIMYGTKWLAAAPILTVVALICVISVPAIPMGSLSMRLGQPHFVTVRTASELVIKTPVIWYAVTRYGINGALMTQVVAGITVLIVAFFAVRQLIGLSVTRQFLALCPTFLGLAAMSATEIGLRPLFDLSRPILFKIATVSCIGVAGIIVYISVVISVWYASGRPNTVEAIVVKRLSSLVGRARGTALI